MYQYFSKVELLINEMIETYGFRGKTITFYKTRIKKFFSEYMGLPNNEIKPLDTISYFDVNTYLKNLECSDLEKSNSYSALKRFFEYTYLKNITGEIISQVTKQVCKRKPIEILKEEEYIKLKNFIVCRDNELNERLILGLFLFTGLSRQYIASLRNNQLIYEDGVYKLNIWKKVKKEKDKKKGKEEEVVEVEVKLPLKSELQLIINEYCSRTLGDNKLDKVIKMKENPISTYIGDLTKSIIGKNCTPTILSNTFIAKALSNGNYIWEVSNLTLESVYTIEQHLKDNDNLVNKQTAILNSF